MYTHNTICIDNINIYLLKPTSSLATENTKLENYTNMQRFKSRKSSNIIHINYGLFLNFL